MSEDRMAQLASEWRERAAGLQEYAPAAATAFLRAAEELETLTKAGDDVLTLTDAAKLSGYSADHLGRLVKQGVIPNVGRAHAPRIRRADLPRKATPAPKHVPVDSDTMDEITAAAFASRGRRKAS